MNKKTLTVEGMSCGHCKNAVETALKEVAGVKEAEVDLDNNQVEVRFTDVDEKDLIAAIEDSGPYQVK